MSWKCTAYVKQLRRSDGITRSEKLLLFTLADYHHSSFQVCWPSVPRLAEEALMSERTTIRLLQRLVDKGLLMRRVGNGRGNVSCYFFPGIGDQPDRYPDGLDPENPEPKRVTTSDQKRVTTSVDPTAERVTSLSVKGDKPLSAIIMNNSNTTKRNTKENQAASQPDTPVDNSSKPTNGNGEFRLTPSMNLSTEKGKKETSAPPDDRAELKRKLVEGAFGYFCKKLDHDPARYVLTEKRRNQGLRRIDELLRLPEAKGYAQPLAFAKEQIKHAIDAMAESDWHVDNSFTDWSLIFRSEEKMQEWMHRWENPPEHKESRL